MARADSPARAAARLARWERIAALYRAGAPLAQIVDALDSTPGSIKTTVSRMRREGWDLPHRRLPGDESEAPNPSGRCMCGCGRLTPIALGTDRRVGCIRGERRRCLQGHNIDWSAVRRAR